ncbi:unnamed protein product [Bemisia tabaci]|uniref:protein acetyllysine N-acetyltransferase n=1 Tax=Bemisia tabaci TaxID=7038 RepID=A0A9P0A1K8_BEMTA|nr:unnamed protein product [Bemisia tabaci]
MDDKKVAEKPSFLKRKAALKVTFCVKKTRDASHKKISAILRKAEHERTEEELQYLCKDDNIVQEVKEKLLKRQRLKDRLQEFEDPPEVLNNKCILLAKAISQSKHLVVYTGAGVSTAARIPDYRGSNGVWTLLEQGKDIGLHDLSAAKPTLTHMALFKLYQEKILKHVVSQNCDGLHLRSGLPRSALSEIHGNMYLEVCHDCEPIRFYLRLFDVTQHTARYSHETLRLCYFCGSPLCDTIVHFGERGVLQWPLNWKTASDNANQADVILCLGSSLKVLKKYPWLWGMDKPLRKRPQLFIVNLQWTPKDEHATLKINGKCDAVFEKVMHLLNVEIPKYSRHRDPIYNHATLIHPVESHITSKPALKTPQNSTNPLPDDGKFLDQSRISSSPLMDVKKEECITEEQPPENVDSKPRMCNEKDSVENCSFMKSIVLDDNKFDVKEEFQEEPAEQDPLQNLDWKESRSNGPIHCGFVKEMVKEEHVKIEPSLNGEEKVINILKSKINCSILNGNESSGNHSTKNLDHTGNRVFNCQMKFFKTIKEVAEDNVVERDCFHSKECKTNSIINEDVKFCEVIQDELEENYSQSRKSELRDQRINSIIFTESSNFRIIPSNEAVESNFAEITVSHNGEQKVINSVILNETSFRKTDFGQEDSIRKEGGQILNGIIIDNGVNFCEIMEQAESAEEDFEETDPLHIGEESDQVIFDCQVMDFSSVDLALGAGETVGISIPADFDEVYRRIRDNIVETSNIINNDWLEDSCKTKSVIPSTRDTQTQDTHSIIKTDSFNDSVSVTAETDKAISSQRCDFCRIYYDSNNCLFYMKFTNANLNFKDRCCLCCESPDSSIAKKPSNSHQNSINPGWFGKGYRKKIKRRK